MSALTSLRAFCPPVGVTPASACSVWSATAVALVSAAAPASLSDGLSGAVSPRRLPLQTPHFHPPSARQPGQSLQFLALSTLRRPPPPQTVQIRKPAPMHPGQCTFSSGSGHEPVPPQLRQGTRRSL